MVVRAPRGTLYSKLLQQTENEEGETDKKLTRSAEGMVNKEAMQGQRAA